MITSSKNYTKKNPKQNGQSEPLDRWQKQSYTDKITQRSIHIHTQKKRERKKEKKKIYIYIYNKKRKRATKSINCQ